MNYKKFSQFIAEFTADGAKYQLSTPSEKTWTSCWSSQVKMGKAVIVFIEAGYTSTTPNNHTAVINVTVKPLKLQNGAEDQADETITVYYADFNTSTEAKAELEKIRSGKGLNEEDPGVPSEEQSLGVQLFTQTAAPTIGI